MRYITVKVGQFKITAKGNVKWKWGSHMEKWATWGHVIMPFDHETDGAKLLLDTTCSRFDDGSTNFQLSQTMVNDLTECFRLFCGANGVRDESILTSYERIGKWADCGCYGHEEVVRMRERFPSEQWDACEAMSFSSNFHQDVIKCLQDSDLVTRDEVQAAIDQVTEVWG